VEDIEICPLLRWLGRVPGLLWSLSEPTSAGRFREDYLLFNEKNIFSHHCSYLINSFNLYSVEPGLAFEEKNPISQMRNGVS
jgi:hypothetical protein